MQQVLVLATKDISERAILKVVLQMISWSSDPITDAWTQKLITEAEQGSLQ